MFAQLAAEYKQLKAQKKELVRGACSNGRLGLRLLPRP